MDFQRHVYFNISTNLGYFEKEAKRKFSFDVYAYSIMQLVWTAYLPN